MEIARDVRKLRSMAEDVCAGVAVLVAELVHPPEQSTPELTAVRSGTSSSTVRSITSVKRGVFLGRRSGAVDPSDGRLMGLV